MRDEFRKIADDVVTRVRNELGVELKYDKESIDWLEGYIERIRSEIKKDSFSELATVLGAYVGETIIATYGGRWEYFENLDQWGVRLADDNGAFPASKIYSQLENGAVAGDSILSFFTIIPDIFTRIKKAE